MGEIDNYMNYLDYLIRINNQILTTDNLKFTNNNYYLNNSTQNSNDEDDKIITTKKYVDKNNVGRFYPDNDNKKGEIFNDYEHNKAFGNYSHASGEGTVADKNNMSVVGQYNIYDANKQELNENKLFVVGNGENDNNRNDALIVYKSGEVYADVFTTIGSDYAELFEVFDNSIPIKEYEYKFITLKGDKVKIASNNDYILGVYSVNPSILGNKIFNNNNDNNNNNKYIPVGLIGKLIVYDYGKCFIDGYCKVGLNGCAIPYNENEDLYNKIYHYRVIKRFDKDKIIIVFK